MAGQATTIVITGAVAIASSFVTVCATAWFTERREKQGWLRTEQREKKARLRQRLEDLIRLTREASAAIEDFWGDIETGVLAEKALSEKNAHWMCRPYLIPQDEMHLIAAFYFPELCSSPAYLKLQDSLINFYTASIERLHAFTHFCVHEGQNVVLPDPKMPGLDRAIVPKLVFEAFTETAAFKTHIPAWSKAKVEAIAQFEAFRRACVAHVDAQELR